MVVPVYLKQRHERTISKYHRMQGEISSKYQLLRQKINPRFHRWYQFKDKQVDQSTIDFVAKYDFPLEENDELDINDERMKSPKDLSFFSEEPKSRTSLNWSRGRISGKVIFILMNQGEIIEKVYLTPKGSQITVRKDELGLLARFYLRTI